MSTSSLLDAVNINIGTGAAQIVPYEESSNPWPGRDQYQTISAQKEFSKFSLEELRTADYRLGRGSARAATTSDVSTTTFTALTRRTLRSDSKKDKSHLDLLRGAGIDIHLGASNPSHSDIDSNVCDTWSLPINLISHHSPFLRAACERDFRERQENRIDLPEDDATVFALFVEWIYYGSYTVMPRTLPSDDSDENIGIDAKCWVLGDKLLCNGFKNYAMSRIYAQHIGSVFYNAVTTNDVRYAFDNSTTNSKLRQFYLDFVVAHFTNPNRLLGTTEEWDALLLDYAEIRLLVLQKFRAATVKRDFIKDAKNYLDQYNALSSDFGKMEVKDRGL